MKIVDKIKKSIRECLITFKAIENKMEAVLFIVAAVLVVILLMVVAIVLVYNLVDALVKINFENLVVWIESSSIFQIINNFVAIIESEYWRNILLLNAVIMIVSIIILMTILEFIDRKGRFKFYFTWIAYTFALAIDIFTIILVLCILNIVFGLSITPNIIVIFGTKLILDILLWLGLLYEFIFIKRYNTIMKYLKIAGCGFIFCLIMVYFVGVFPIIENTAYIIYNVILLGLFFFGFYKMLTKDFTKSVKKTYGTIYVSDIDDIFAHHYIAKSNIGKYTNKIGEFRTIFVDLTVIKPTNSTLSFDSTEDYWLTSEADKKSGFYISININRKAQKGRHYFFFDITDKNNITAYCYVLNLMWREGELIISRDKLVLFSVRKERKAKKSANISAYKDFLCAVSGSIINFKLTQFNKRNKSAIEYEELCLEEKKLKKAEYDDTELSIEQVVKRINECRKKISVIRRTGATKISENGIKLAKIDDNDKRNCVLLNQKYGTGKTLACIAGVTELGYRALTISFWKNRITKGYIFSLFKHTISNEGETLWFKITCCLRFYCYKQIALTKNLHLSVYLIIVCSSMLLFNDNFFKMDKSINIGISLLITSALMPYIMLIKREESSSDIDYYLYLIVKLMKIKNIVFIMEDIDRSTPEQADASLRILSNLSDEIYESGKFSECRIIISLDIESKVIQKHTSEIEKIVYYTYRNEEESTQRYIEELKKYFVASYGEDIAKEFEKECKKASKEINLRLVKNVFREFIERYEG